MTSRLAIRLGIGLTLLALLCLNGRANANDEDQVLAKYEKHQFKNSQNETLNYRWYLPERSASDSQVPLIVFLHGAGERGADNEKPLVHGAADFLSAKVQQKQPCAVLVPQCPEGEQWVNVPWSDPSHTLPNQPSDSLRLVAELLNELCETHPIDTDRIYLTGLSMGGFGAWDLVSRYPSRFAAVVPICGGGDARAEVVSKFKSVPIWAFHGEVDEAVQVQRSREMIAALTKAGGQPKYTEYPQTGHNSWTATYANPELYEWLFKQRRENHQD